MKRYIKSSQEESVIATLLVDVYINCSEAFGELAAAELITHPTNPTSETFYLTDSSLDMYDNLIMNALAVIESNGLSYVADNPKKQSPESYTFYGKFYVPSVDVKNRFDAIFRLFDHDKGKYSNQQKLERGAVTYNIEMIQDANLLEVGTKDKHPVYELVGDFNLIRTNDLIANYCEDFIAQVSSRLHRTDMLTEWSELYADSHNIGFELRKKDSGNPIYVFKLTDLEVQVRESYMLYIDSYGSFSEYIDEVIKENR